MTAPGQNDDATAASAETPRIALALAGGGPEGAIYEIGALRALDEVCDGLDLNQLFLYVGVSAGAFIAACLANDLTSAQMCRAIVSSEPGEHPFVPETFLSPAVRSFWRGALALPALLADALLEYARDVQKGGTGTLLGSLMRLGRALPTAVFDNEPIRAYLEKIYNLKSRTDDFRRLGKRLVIVAADFESGTETRFGDGGITDVPISRAVQASTALPGIYPPVEIGGRHYVDGVLLKTLHASVALEAGASLVLCINPIVGFDTASAIEKGVMKRGDLLEKGLPTVLSQTLRTIIHSRMEVGMASYAAKYRSSDVLLFEPERDDYLMFFTNILSFAERRAVCEHAYASTRRYLRDHFDELAPVFARAGVTLRRDLLAGERNVWEQVGLSPAIWDTVADAAAPAPAEATAPGGGAARPVATAPPRPRAGRRPTMSATSAASATSARSAASRTSPLTVRRLDEALNRIDAMLAERVPPEGPPGA